VPPDEKQGHKSWLPEVRNLTGESAWDADALHAVSISTVIFAEKLVIRRIGIATWLAH
jgi:hypothetical protein